jgi:hypothetical protein
MSPTTKVHPVHLPSGKSLKRVEMDLPTPQRTQKLPDYFGKSPRKKTELRMRLTTL